MGGGDFLAAEQPAGTGGIMNPSNRSLLERIGSMIEANGPLSVAEYMSQCLYDPIHGYYTQHQPIGTKGDFTTAPEISQMFGELIGVWCIKIWGELGRPKAFNLVELGPGRGTMMADIVRTAKLSPDFLTAADLHLIEINPMLKNQQLEALSDCDKPIHWHNSISDLPDGPVIVIANEFLDCLPIHQFVKTENGWHERQIHIADEELAFNIGPAKLEASHLPKNAATKPPGTIFETSPARSGFVQQVAEHLRKVSGAALFIDYGSALFEFGDTFQAIYNQKKNNPLHHPGESDLTSHVDFATLRAAAHECDISTAPILTQGDFLLGLGLLERAGALGYGRSKPQQAEIQTAVERLAGPSGMGDLFKVFCMHCSQTPLAPFDFEV